MKIYIKSATRVRERKLEDSGYKFASYEYEGDAQSEERKWQEKGYDTKLLREPTDTSGLKTYSVWIKKQPYREIEPGVKLYINKFGDEFIVREATLSQFKEYALSCIEGIEYNEEVHPGTYSDMSIYIEYKDGSIYHNIDGDISGEFKRTGIKFGMIDDGSEYMIYGNYILDENMIPQSK